jgi:hypothetical protein
MPIIFLSSLYSAVGNGYGLDGRGLIPSKCKIFIFSLASRQTVGRTQPPIQWVPGAIPLGVKQSARETNHSPPSNVEVFMVWCWIN